MAAENKSVFYTGLFFFAAMSVLVCFVLMLGDFSFQEDYRIFVVFSHINGLQTGSPVELLGVKIGSVKNFYLREGKNQGEVCVVLHILKKYKIPASADVFIDTTGILGEKYVSIRYHGDSVNRFLKDGDEIRGRDPLLFNDAFDQFQKSLERFSQLMADVNQLVTDVEFRDRLKITVDNMAVVSENLNTSLNEAMSDLKSVASSSNLFIRHADNLLRTGEIRMDQVFDDLKKSQDSINLFLKQLDFPQSGEVKSGLAENIRGISEKTERILDNADRLFSAETADNIRTAFSRFSSISEKFQNLMNLKNSVSASGKIYSYYSADTHDSDLDLEFMMSSGSNIRLECGLCEIDSRKDGSFFLGKGLDFCGYIGVYNGEPAFRLQKIYKDIQLEVDFVSRHEGFYRATLDIEGIDGFGVLFRHGDLYGRDQFSCGVRYRF